MVVKFRKWYNVDVRHAETFLKRESKRQIVRKQAERSNFFAAPWTENLKLKLTGVQDSE